MEEIIVKSQTELNAIKADYKGRIYIEFGSLFVPAIVNKKYLYSVVARGNSSVVARENSSVVAWGNSSVEAWENSSVVAWGNSSVEAWGNCQIVNKGTKGELSTNCNARIVYDPKNIQEYCDFYGIKLDNGVGRFFKSVHKEDGRYFSDHNKNYNYKIGEVCIPDFFDNSTKENCGHGIHVAYLNWAINFGKSWNDLAILEVEAKLDDIVVPDNGNGKVRCKEAKIIREIPLEECGLYGKFLAKQRKEK